MNERRASAGYVAALWLPLAGFGIAAKLAKAAALAAAASRGLGVRSIAAVVSSELVFYGFAFLGWDLFLHLDGPRRINADHVPVHGTYPLSRWEPGDYIVDRHTVSPRPAAEPERFQVRLGFWQRDSTARAEVTAAPPLSVTTDRAVELGTIDVSGPLTKTDVLVTTTAPESEQADVRFGGLVRLLSAASDRTTVKAGLKVTTTCVFQSLSKLGRRFQLKAELEGPTRRTETHTPGAGMAPLETWPVGQYVRDRQVLMTKTTDKAGTYRVMLTLFDTERGKAVEAKGHGLPIVDGRVQIAEYTLVP